MLVSAKYSAVVKNENCVIQPRHCEGTGAADERNL